MKSSRHFVIREILNQQRITTQEELCQSLKEKGFNVTQATVSRDIKELQLVKVSDDEGYKYGLPENHIPAVTERIKRIMKDSIRSIDHNESLIVIKTLPGGAQGVASLIDASRWNNILGTVAGDDTIFVAVKQKNQVGQVIKEFQTLLSK